MTKERYYRPMDLMLAVRTARSLGDLQGALACYEDCASVVMEPGRVLTGREAVRAFNEAVAGFHLELGDQRVLEFADLALYVGQWQLVMAEEGAAVGRILQGTCLDVLRRQSDGSWLIALDNPWGPSIFVTH